jgi:dihydrofolate reductase
VFHCDATRPPSSRYLGRGGPIHGPGLARHATLEAQVASSNSTAHGANKLKQDGHGYIVAHGGISFWRSLARLDLIDEYRMTLIPYLAGEGARLFEDVGKSRSLDLLSSTAFSSGLQLEYRRHR